MRGRGRPIVLDGDRLDAAGRRAAAVAAYGAAAVFLGAFWGLVLHLLLGGAR